MSEHHNQPEQEPRPGLHPRVWIGSLADYNAGRLVGDWLDAAVTEDELLAGVGRILATSSEPNAEEWGIFDYDEFGSFRVNEYDDLAIVSTVARGIAEHGAAFAAWAQLHDGDLDMLRSFDDAYIGHFESSVAFADHVIADYDLDQILDQAVPGWLRAHVQIDREGIVRDIELSGDVDIERAPDGIWVFDTR